MCIRGTHDTQEGRRVQEKTQQVRFEQIVLPHLDAAYNLARWLTRNDQDAEDVVQEACLRAFKFFAGFYGGDSRAWLLTIVRNTGYTWLRHNRAHELTTPFDETIHDVECDALNPEALLLHQADQQQLRQALEALPVEFREVIVLRELEGAVVQGDWRDRRHSPGDGHVAPGPCPQAAPTRPGQALEWRGLT